ncbi:DUF2877 domain-containing protein [Nocardioides panacisoli]|uniref:oxamate carbamoyltransferase subunit AllH family protein n=1 Tax=Nocardioides panacisoli TaxID=627624 RepID=UPI001C638C99|nr:DUF2877 domain-containing protein [Nocardioides panacisoli]QYJ02888.1 DUF2877 domain-containing protein [Nocardioides panacisoli]
MPANPASADARGVADERRRLMAAATPATAAMLAGPERSGTVVHSGADAAYLHLSDGGCLAVLGVHARAVPCGLRTALTTLDLPHGAVGIVGSDTLRIADLELRVGRYVDAGVPALPSDATDGLPTITDHPAVRAVADELPAAALAALREGDPACVADLLGRGSGLTPVGDDVLCGYLATAVAAGNAAATTAVAEEITHLAHRRTTALSAQLLACAVDGDVLPEFAALVRSLPDPGRATAALAALVAVGHTSGAGLALGLTLAPIHSGRTNR